MYMYNDFFLFKGSLIKYKYEHFQCFSTQAAAVHVHVLVYVKYYNYYLSFTHYSNSMYTTVVKQ